MEEMDQNKGKLSRKEIIQNIINRSKVLKEEKQRIKQENRDKIQQLDDNFTELSSLLQKRGRTFSKFNDDYDRFASAFVHADKTHPTVIKFSYFQDRLKSEQEIAIEKEMKSDKLNKKRMREEIMKDSDEENEDKLDDIADKKKLTKKERIEKLIADRLNKSGKVVKEDIISKRKNSGDEENEDADNLSDLDEFNKGAEGEEEEEEDGEDDEGEDDDDEGDDVDGDDEEGEDIYGEDGENQFDFLNDLEGIEFEEGEDAEEEPEEEEIKPKKSKKKGKAPNKRR